MIWILAVHIMALLLWCASLLFLQSLLAGFCPGATGEASVKRAASQDEAHKEQVQRMLRRHDSVARYLFTGVVTPSALLAIVAGTWVFLLASIATVWLIAKLTLVTALVVCHALTGLMVLRAERGAAVRGRCWLLIAVSIVLMLLIVWLVLDKPEVGVLL